MIKKVKKQSRNAWIQRHCNDTYVKLAQKNKYRSRAAFKLLEILNMENLILPGDSVIDLGASPGGWSQVIHERLKNTSLGFSKTGKIFALDLLPMKSILGVEFIQGDFEDVAILQQLEEMMQYKLVDVVVSDMSPSLSGIRNVDSVRIKNLCESVVNFSSSHIKTNGSFLMKTFHNSDFPEVLELTKSVFKTVFEYKPKASRKESSEVFLMGRGLKR